MQHLKIGHFTDTERGTGVSVFLFDAPACGVYQVCGSSPASRELHALSLEARAAELHALVLTGGSAYGLGTADGVMRFLQEQGRGIKMPHGVVPIVPVAAIYDLLVKTSAFPTAEDAYQACLNATEFNTLQGRIGAGTGASVGKIVPHAASMAGGLGHATLSLNNGVIVTAYAVVNALGDIRDADGTLLASGRLANGEFVDSEKFLFSATEDPILARTNTTLVAVFTNAAFTKAELQRISKIALSGFARAISPVFTQYDGDIIFCISMGDKTASEFIVGTLAAEAVRQAIVNSIQEPLIYAK